MGIKSDQVDEQSVGIDERSFCSCTWRLTCIPPRVTWKRCSGEEALAPFLDDFTPLRLLEGPTARISIGRENRVKYLRVRMAISSFPRVSAPPQLFYLPGSTWMAQL